MLVRRLRIADFRKILEQSRSRITLISPCLSPNQDFSNKVKTMVDKSDNHITRVLFCGPQFHASHNYTREYLRSYPFIQVDDVPLDDVPDVIPNYHICVVKCRRLDSKVIASANQMKLIMQFGVGLEGVDIDAATRCGIKVARIPGNVSGSSASCAEMAIYLMLGLLRKQIEVEIPNPHFATAFIFLNNPIAVILIADPRRKTPPRLAKMLHAGASRGRIPATSKELFNYRLSSTIVAECNQTCFRSVEEKVSNVGGGADLLFP
ncbi:hypothetical protein HHK36_009201 [Tetracentron sinense]|uniref:D-isomer specific 2-hydroxyacid dehydrogenase catalytic domain-containing protein n=1 Tax=Tetracentron sinense TaxID=13715 RepID=A0A834ZFT8_TETSI|nr:hypothetical protein HHK36_009201 [Tetracentron sinense]